MKLLALDTVDDGCTTERFTAETVVVLETQAVAFDTSRDARNEVPADFRLKIAAELIEDVAYQLAGNIGTVSVAELMLASAKLAQMSETLKDTRTPVSA